MAHQPIYETTLGTRVKHGEPDPGPGPTGPESHNHPPRAAAAAARRSTPPGSAIALAPGSVSHTRPQGRHYKTAPTTGRPRPKPPPHHGSSRSATVSSSTQQQPVPTPHASSSSGGGNPSTPTAATRDHDPVFRQASAAIDQSHPPPRSPTSGNAPAGAVAVKRSIYAGVKALSPGAARRTRHSGHSNEAPPQNGSDHALQPPRAPPPEDSLPSYPCDSP
ncbi:uncharacterized protein LOC119449293 [Dermacentor silvarum]|uniref:uncharacterized protein LOC119449293 n=1 Tax=Dermacentor silvarum TaxID=543639 RepID=UPI0018977A33|nr:uncharacterized protein LOC119449293 [Dermacentor silvarum]